jgi:thiol-disulfide isomerase/thioredoxin
MAAMNPQADWLVVCLCASWCRSCDAYRQTFDAVACQFSDWRFVWIDIEDESELLDDYDVATFPTLFVGDASNLRFAGPLTPQAETLLRLLTSLRANEAPAVKDGEAQAFWKRLRQRK